jgi:urease accessory protein
VSRLSGRLSGRFPARLLLLAALLGVAGEAAAHGSVQGLGNFFSGIVHPLLEPAHAMALLVLGLLIGRQGLKNSQPALPGFVLALVAGLVAAGADRGLDTSAFVLAAAALTGLAVAGAQKLPPLATAAVAACLGLGIGLDSRPQGLDGSAMAVMLLGIAIGCCVWLLNVIGLVHQLRRAWLQVLVRVVASWVSAAAVLVLALWVAGRPLAPAPASAAQFESSRPVVVLDTVR